MKEYRFFISSINGKVPGSNSWFAARGAERKALSVALKKLFGEEELDWIGGVLMTEHDVLALKILCPSVNCIEV